MMAVVQTEGLLGSIMQLKKGGGRVWKHLKHGQRK